MGHARLTPEEVARRGKEIYEREVRPLVDTPGNQGREVVIDVESGDYEVDDDGLSASRRLHARHPDAALYGLRIGFNAVYSLGGTVRPVKQ
jgi:hypothetical protein